MRRTEPGSARVLPWNLYPRSAHTPLVRYRLLPALLGVALLSVTMALAAQRETPNAPRFPLNVEPNLPYDGRFSLARVIFRTAQGGFWFRGWPAWAHGYPVAEVN